MIRLFVLALLIFTASNIRAQSDSVYHSPPDTIIKVKDTVTNIVGISGDSRYHKYNIQVIGENGDSMSVYDSAHFKLPLKSKFYKLRVSRIKGEQITDYEVKGYNITFNVGTDSIYIASMSSRYIEEPLLTKFKNGTKGDMFSIGDIVIKDEKGRIVKAGSYLLFYE